MAEMLDFMKVYLVKDKKLKALKFAVVSQSNLYQNDPIKIYCKEYLV